MIKKLLYPLILSVAMFVSSFAQTQQVDLMNNEWYVHKVVLSGVEHLAPINQERANWQVNSSEFLFNAGAIYLYFCTSCTLQGINFLPNNEFKVDDMVCLAMNDCNRQLGNDNSDYLLKFYDVFQVNQPNTVFQYEVTTVNSSTKQLKIINEDGDEAYFYSSKLSVTTKQFSKVTLFPNPVENSLNINLESVPEMNCKFIFYDITGKQVKAVEHLSAKVISIDTNDLLNGVYFLTILNDKGIVQKIEKIIKK
ncbi:Por secretion system C-terminal sorting domain-containing protein [Paenimyroides ummariense]|uniref:Por secretion system C-terminal sorting domain-containing protein n=1 Tax=Paenimyroides ummariense TaxID=913024 RepID=A0A1I5CI25_9FLAO|nr:T9SS type A sorting domain-containing protein [Paenimyroides ummariense]SFN86638.1 Por secretion system C-terminal sorting domain-containing protein [Paenimyroides ummariense]